MSILKVIELMANSTKSWEDATSNAVAHAFQNSEKHSVCIHTRSSAGRKRE